AIHCRGAWSTDRQTQPSTPAPDALFGSPPYLSLAKISRRRSRFPILVAERRNRLSRLPAPPASFRSTPRRASLRHLPVGPLPARTGATLFMPLMLTDNHWNSR